MKFNDSINMVYYIVMLLALISPALFFVRNTALVQWAVLIYIAGYIFVINNGLSINRMDISSNWLKYVLYAVGFFFLFGVMVQKGDAVAPFTGNIAKLVWYIFVIGLSESFIREGIFRKTGSLILTCIVLGLLHVSSYMILFGASLFDPLVLGAVFTSMVGFAIFHIVYKFSNDFFIEALAHGLYDFFVMGGLMAMVVLK